MKTNILTAMLALASLPAFAGSTAPAIDQTAITTTEAPEWSLRFDIYGWAQALDGDIDIRRLSVPVDVGFDDILENLDIAVMGAVAVNYGRWSFLADFNYAEIEADATLLRGRIPVEFTQQQFLGNFTVGYGVVQSGTTTFEVYGGVRVNAIDVELDFGKFDRSTDKSWVDPIIGARFQTDLSDKWFVRAVGDIGGFGVASDFTWQAMAGVGYRVTGNGALLLGYRGIGTDYTDGGFTYDIVAHGPVIGFECKF